MRMKQRLKCFLLRSVFLEFAKINKHVGKLDQIVMKSTILLFCIMKTELLNDLVDVYTLRRHVVV